MNLELSRYHIKYYNKEFLMQSSKIALYHIHKNNHNQEVIKTSEQLHSCFCLNHHKKRKRKINWCDSRKSTSLLIIFEMTLLLLTFLFVLFILDFSQICYKKTVNIVKSQRKIILHKIGYANLSIGCYNLYAHTSPNVSSFIHFKRIQM